MGKAIEEGIKLLTYNIPTYAKFLKDLFKRKH